MFQRLVEHWIFFPHHEHGNAATSSVFYLIMIGEASKF